MTWWENAPVISQGTPPPGTDWWMNAPVVSDPRAERDARMDARVAKEESALPFLPKLPDASRGLPFADEVASGLNAGLNYLTDGKLGETYDDGMAYRRARGRYAEKNYPIRQNVASLASAVATAPYLPVARVMQGATLLPQIANGATSGAIYGGLFGAGEGEGEERITNAAIGTAAGGVLGSLAPAISRGVRNAYEYGRAYFNRLTGAAAGYERSAVDKVTRALDNDGVLAPGPTSYGNRRTTLGDDGMLADMGPNARGQAVGIASQPGEGASILRRALQERRNGAGKRIKGAIDYAFGPEQNLITLEKDALAAASKNARPAYDAFYAQDVPMTPDLEDIMRRVDATGAQRKAQDLATIEGHTFAGNKPTGREYDYIKRALDDNAKPKSITGASQEERAYGNLARDLRNAVDAATAAPTNQIGPQPSYWALARKLAGDGQQFKQGLADADRAFARAKNPDVVAEELRRGSPVYQAAYRAAARGDVADQMNNAATGFGENSAAAARRGLWSANADRKIDLLARHDAAARGLRNRRDAETEFAETYNNTLQGSKTAATRAAQKEFPNAGENGGSGARVSDTTLLGGALTLSRKALNAMSAGAYNEYLARVSRDAATILSRQGPERDALMRAITARRQAFRNAGQRGEEIERTLRLLVDGARNPAIEEATN